MVLFVKDENKMKDLWAKGIVTKFIYSKDDNIPRTVELQIATRLLEYICTHINPSSGQSSITPLSTK